MQYQISDSILFIFFIILTDFFFFFFSLHLWWKFYFLIFCLFNNLNEKGKLFMWDLGNFMSYWEKFVENNIKILSNLRIGERKRNNNLHRKIQWDLCLCAICIYGFLTFTNSQGNHIIFCNIEYLMLVNRLVMGHDWLQID